MNQDDMLLAFHIRKEVYERLAPEIDKGLIPADQAPRRLFEAAKTIIQETETIAELIRLMREDPSNTERVTAMMLRQGKGI